MTAVPKAVTSGTNARGAFKDSNGHSQDATKPPPAIAHTLSHIRDHALTLAGKRSPEPNATHACRGGRNANNVRPQVDFNQSGAGMIDQTRATGNASSSVAASNFLQARLCGVISPAYRQVRHCRRMPRPINFGGCLTRYGPASGHQFRNRPACG